MEEDSGANMDVSVESGQPELEESSLLPGSESDMNDQSQMSASMEADTTALEQSETLGAEEGGDAAEEAPLPVLVQPNAHKTGVNPASLPPMQANDDEGDTGADVAGADVAGADIAGANAAGAVAAGADATGDATATAPGQEDGPDAAAQLEEAPLPVLVDPNAHKTGVNPASLPPMQADDDEGDTGADAASADAASDTAATAAAQDDGAAAPLEEAPLPVLVNPNAHKTGVDPASLPPMQADDDEGDMGADTAGDIAATAAGQDDSAPAAAPAEGGEGVGVDDSAAERRGEDVSAGGEAAADGGGRGLSQPISSGSSGAGAPPSGGGGGGGGSGGEGGRPISSGGGAERVSISAGNGMEQALDSLGGLPDAREIEVDMGPDRPPVKLSLTVEREAARKPFYGGYRHKLTGVEYHHGATQTDPPPRKRPAVEDLPPVKFHRDTQTVTVQEQAQQNVREYGTQMPKEGFHYDGRLDYVIVPRTYLDSDQWVNIRLKATIVIQCYTRGMFARTLARTTRTDMDRSRRYFLEQQEREHKAREAERSTEIERRMHPKTPADFDILYKELAAWQVSETQKIEISDMSEESKALARYQLVLKEVKLVQTIDALRAGAARDGAAMQVTKELERMAAPKLWQTSDGKVALVETPTTTRAKELSELYQGLRLSNLKPDERLDVLLTAKWTVKEYDTKLTRELVELLDREADLLNRGRGDKSLEGLRRRILRAFLQLVRDPLFNPEAASVREERL